MKKIILIRHAKVDLDNSQNITSKELQKWIKEYNNAPICKDSKPSQKTIKLAQSADIVLTSSLKRTELSANKLSLNIDEKDTIFDEAKIPDIDIPFLKLNPEKWLMIIRVLSLFGLGKIGVSLNKSKAKAKKATSKLVLFSTKHDKVLLFGHGGMNYLIRKELLKDGWKLKEKLSNKNWGTEILVK